MSVDVKNIFMTRNSNLDHRVPHLRRILLLDVSVQKVHETPDQNSHTSCHCVTDSGSENKLLPFLLAPTCKTTVM